MLVTCVGSGVAISIIKAIKFARSYITYGVDCNHLATGLYLVDKAFVSPKITQFEEYINFLIHLCIKEKIDFLIPGSDLDLMLISENKNRLEKESLCFVIVNSIETLKIGLNKYQTYRFLKKNNFKYPKTFRLNQDMDEREITLPMIAKPIFGSGSIGLQKITNHYELKNLLENNSNKDYILQEFINKEEEFTAGILYNKNGQIVDCIILKRKLKKGYTYFAKTHFDNELKQKILKIAKKIKGLGSVNMQFKLLDGLPIIFEINPRFSGTTVCRAMSGFNEINLFINHFLEPDKKLQYSMNSIIMVRYLSEVFITPEDSRNFAGILPLLKPPGG